ncbi:MAG: mechanosensitive ion channel family protein [bacterium]|nr:mechanosensitive ion channel family protein [bacterium]
MKIFDYRFYESLIIILLSIVVYFIFRELINKIVKKSNTNNKRITYIKLIRSIIKYILIFVDLLYILHLYGVNVTSIAAGLGIVTLVVTLSLQDALKDIIMGFNLIIDDYFKVGDIIIVDNFKGKVIEIGFKTTKLKGIDNNNIYIVANRNLSSALNISNWLDINIPLPYEEKILKVEELINVIINKIKKLNKVENVEYKGLQEFSDSAIYYKIRIFVSPEFQPQIERDAKRIIKLELDDNNICIPYMQIDIHKK